LKTEARTIVASFGEDITGTRITTPRNCLDSNTSEDGFCNPETEHDRRKEPRIKFFISARTLLEPWSLVLKLSWVLLPVNMFVYG
jgi:hypothetical protein